MYTENNSNEMKTVVETFVIEETAELIYDNEKLDKWNAHVAELGLKGQTKIVKPEKSPIPFLHMKKGLVNVFETLCPRKVSVEEYDASPIPVEILDLIALSKRENYFTKIEIWYDDRTPDPVCVGVVETMYSYLHKPMGGSERFDFLTKEEQEENRKKPNHYFSGSEIKAQYLLGKWADVKHSFEELKEMAKKRFIEIKGAELRKDIKEAQRGLDDLESKAVEQFN